MRELILVRPTDLYEEQVMSYREEMLKNGDSFDGCAGLENVQSFLEWIDFERRLREQYKDGYVPSEVFLAVRQRDQVVVGILPICREFGEERVLLTCDKDNEASRRTIISNHGVLENEVEDTVGLGQCGVIQRYWISL